MNHSLTTGTVPSDFKTAIVKPFLKKPSLDPNALSNYRPISNLPFLSKIVETIVLRQLLAHLDTHNLLSVHRSAYCKGHGTEAILLCIVNHILCALDEDEISVPLVLDVSAAFDTVNHEILLSRLIHFPVSAVEPYHGSLLTCLKGNNLQMFKVTDLLRIQNIPEI